MDSRCRHCSTVLSPAECTPSCVAFRIRGEYLPIKHRSAEGLARSPSAQTKLASPQPGYALAPPERHCKPRHACHQPLPGLQRHASQGTCARRGAAKGHRADVLEPQGEDPPAPQLRACIPGMRAVPTARS